MSVGGGYSTFDEPGFGVDGNVGKCVQNEKGSDAGDETVDANMTTGILVEKCDGR